MWSLEDGIASGLKPDQGDDARWKRDAWDVFFGLPSARLMFLRPGDTAVLRAGAFHRVFTLKTKVCVNGGV